jgi:hypothetical protein
MGRQARDSIGRKRLTLDLHPEIHQRMRILRDDTMADSLTEVVRRSLAVYEFLWKYSSEGATVLIETQDGKRLIVPLLP